MGRIPKELFYQPLNSSAGGASHHIVLLRLKSKITISETIQGYWLKGFFCPNLKPLTNNKTIVSRKKTFQPIIRKYYNV